MNRRALSLLLAALLLLAGCSEAPPPSQSPEPAPLEEAAAPETLIVGIAQDFDSLDPAISQATGTQEVMFNIFHGLINTTTEGEIIPELCEDYTASDDLLTYTFYLREDVVFHNGQPMTAQDVVYTYARLMGTLEGQEAPLNEEFAKNIASVEAPDSHTVVFTLREPSAAFISLCITGIIPQGSGDTQARNPVGAGPYRFVSYTPGVGISMAYFEEYYGQEPFFKQAEFRIFTDDTAVQLALQNGEIHVMKYEQSVFTYDENKLKLQKQPQNMVQMLAFNHAFEPFSHKEVRQAVNHAIDKKALIEALSPGSLQIDTNFSPVMEFYYNFDLTDYYKRDVDYAKELLKSAGYPDLTFTVKVPAEYKFHVDTALILKQQLEEAGITMHIETIEWSTWLTDVYADFNHEATIVGLTGKIDPGSVMIRPTTGYARNFFNYANPEYDALVAEAARTADQNQRAELYKTAQMWITQDAVMVPLMDPGNTLIMDRHIQDYLTYPIGYIDLRSIRWE